MGPTLIFLHRTHKLCDALILGYAVARLVDALRYKSEGRGFDFRRCHRKFSLTSSFRTHYGPGVGSADTHQTLCCRITTNNLHITPLHTERHAHTPNVMLPHYHK
jgi:hypothetical protein